MTHILRSLSASVFNASLLVSVLAGSVFFPQVTLASTVGSAKSTATVHLEEFKARPPVHTYGSVSDKPMGLTPDQVKTAYNLPKTGGKNTIAIITAFNQSQVEKDLAVFDAQFKLPECTTANGCLEIHPASIGIKNNVGWALETALDVEWAHAIAPNAKILVVEAKNDTGPELMRAIDYARGKSDVVAVSMSWGGDEFADQIKYDSHFVGRSASTTSATSSDQVQQNQPTFFAASGDSGYGVSWPASSPNVVAVGGTALRVKTDGTFISETAWKGSGGGVSKYEAEPAYQKDYDISKAKGKRAVPDVAYNADPQTGFSVYHKSAQGKRFWYVVGGTSAGAPQWAAIKALGGNASNAQFYQDKASDNNKKYFRDIQSGSNGKCAYYCDARRRYDYITGLGSPLTDMF